MFSDLIELQHKDYPKQQLKLSTIWLRDHCRCIDCFNPIMKQRTFDLTQLPKDLQVSKICENTDGSILVLCKYNSFGT